MARRRKEAIPIKVFCPIKKLNGAIIVERKGENFEITNFTPISGTDADEITNTIVMIPPVGMNLLPSEDTHKRVAHSVDLSKKCKCQKGQMSFQCLYCSQYEIPGKGLVGKYEIYFLMDESGSMSKKDRTAGVTAIKKMVSSMADMDNIYTFVPWGTEAGYIFKGINDPKKMEKGLQKYIDGETGYRGETCADTPFILIKRRVQASPIPSIIIFVTDGAVKSVTKAKKARDELLKARPDTIIYAVGIAEAKKETIEMIRTDDGSPVDIKGSSADLSNVFSEIAAKVKRNINM